MVGVVVATHGALAQALLSEAIRATGPADHVAAVEVSTRLPVSQLRETLDGAVQGVDDGGGTLILVDLLGGTPCNLGLPLCSRPDVEVVTGTNLPMVIRALVKRRDLPLAELAAEVAAYGVRAIGLPSPRVRGATEGRHAG